MDNKNQLEINGNELEFDYDGALHAIGDRISDFFKTIAERDAEDIWAFMSNDFKRRSIEEHNSEKYKLLFQADRLPSKIVIDNVTVLSPHKIECTAACLINDGRLTSLRKVYFENRSLDNIGEIGHLVQTRIDQMREVDAEKAKIIQRVSLNFDCEDGVWYWTGFAINHGNSSALILDPFKKLVIRTYEFSFIEVDGVWLADNVHFLSEVPAPEDEDEDKD